MKYLLFIPLLFQFFPDKPTNYVTDPEDILSLYEEAQLNDRLKAFEDSTSNQIFVFIDKRMHAGSIEDQTKKIFNKWGIGQKDKNNGVLIAIFVDDREHRIQVGYGLEQALPPSLCLEILDEDMAPEFKEGHYYMGIKAGVDQLIYYTKHEYVPGDPNKTLWIAVFVAFAINTLFAVVNLSSLKKFTKAPKKRKRYTILVFVFLLVPLLAPAVYLALHSTNGILLSLLPFAGALASVLLCMTISDKDSKNNDFETDDYYQRRMYDRRTESSSDDSFDGGGGGSSGDGGASSKW
ncbi:MAG: TPM domain-containing protein [Bacteroidota bacterium]